MPTIKEIQGRIDRANRLLKQDIPPKDRLRIAALKLVDQKRIELRKRCPELDCETRMQ